MTLSTQQKKLPIGIQSFSQLRNRNCYYVDKTELLADLATESIVFLSRPRRFGKSLTLDTLDELFSGNKALFTGLYAEDNWDWETTYPVIRISFGSGMIKSIDILNHTIKSQLVRSAEQYDIELQDSFIHIMFTQLIQQLEAKYNQNVVILVDEYDKPMLDNLNKEYIIDIRNELRGFYSVIKEQNSIVRFAMLTGVSKFSKVNMFSGLNNPNDITLDTKYSALCGYTQDELESVFADRLHDVDMDRVKEWYNGYNWTGESVYNPFDILLFLENGKKFKPYWSETGTPTFLFDTLLSQQTKLFAVLEKMADENLLAKFDVNNLQPVALMFQTGYLTIDKEMDTPFGMQYTLKYPNKEVRQSLNSELLTKYIGCEEINLGKKKLALFHCIQDKDFDGLENLLIRLFASILYNWYVNNNMAHSDIDWEGYWASVFYSFFSSVGFNIRAEDSTNQGRVDMTLQHGDDVFVFEFKVVEKIKETEDGEHKVTSKSKGSAIQQIKDKDYAKKFTGKNVYLVGVEFSEQERNVLNFEWERC